MQADDIVRLVLELCDRIARTHGHGQGYLDVNGLIPEVVERIDYRKGPYFARNGDFAAAGSADIQYRTALDEAVAPNDHRNG